MSDKMYYWLKLKRDFFKRHDIRIIEAMPNGKDYILFYLKLLCESIDHDGNLRFSEKIPYSETMLATLTDTNVDIVRSAIKVFSELGMMEVLDDGTYFMSEVERLVGSETDWAQKKRKQRVLPKLANGSTRINGEMLKLPDGSIRYVDEKRYGGNGMLVLDRAKGKCEICGSDENVVIHHNNGYSNDPSDLICLCSKCHGKVHSGEIGGTISTICPPVVRQEKEKEKEKELEKDIKVRRFTPPTPTEVQQYCSESGHNIDADAFVDFYSSKNWMVGKNKMKDWKSAVRNWERRDKEKNHTGNRFNNFEQQREEIDPYALGLFANN